MRKLFSNPILVFFVAIGLQGLWRLVLEPMARLGMGESAANFLFVALRVGVMVGLPLMLAWGCRFSRFGALAATALATLIESVGFTVLSLPEAPALTLLLQVFILNLPIVLLFGLAGYELGRRLGSAPAQAEPPQSTGG